MYVLPPEKLNPLTPSLHQYQYPSPHLTMFSTLYRRTVPKFNHTVSRRWCQSYHSHEPALFSSSVDKIWWKFVLFGASVGGVCGGMDTYRREREDEKNGTGFYYKRHIPPGYQAFVCIFHTTCGVCLGGFIGLVLTNFLPLIVPVGAVVMVARFLDPPTTPNTPPLEEVERE